MRLCAAILPVVLAVAVPASLGAGTVTPDFEGFSDTTVLATQYPGLTFSDATVISAGITLNEFELPPHSGTNVVFDDGGPVSMGLVASVVSFSNYFTYYEPITLAAYDAQKKAICVGG